MCLRVTHIPTSKKSARIIKSHKWMESSYASLRSPYRCVSPINGWIVCNIAKRYWYPENSVWTRIKPTEGLSIGPGVHAYVEKDYNHYPAYSIGVFAYNYNKYWPEVVSGMLYLPCVGTPEMTRLVKRFYKDPSKRNFIKIMEALPDNKDVRGAAKRTLKKFF